MPYCGAPTPTHTVTAARSDTIAGLQAPAEAPAAAAVCADWQRSLAAWLVAHKTYPDAARRTGTEGVVVLRLTADRSGRVVEVTVRASAGNPALDAAAKPMLRGAMLPPFPAAMPQDSATVTVRQRYRLTD